MLLAVQQVEAWILQGPPGFWERHSGACVRLFVLFHRSPLPLLSSCPPWSDVFLCPTNHTITAAGLILVALVVGALVAYTIYQEQQKVSPCVRVRYRSTRWHGFHGG